MRRLATIITLFVICRTSLAQSFHYVTVKDGLPDNYAGCIAQDSEGYMWFATLNGLDRYDGYSHKVYSLLDCGFRHNNFSYVAIDSRNNVWAKSSGGEIFIYDRATDRLCQGLQKALSPMVEIRDSVTNVIVDRNKDLWLETESKIYHIDYRDNVVDTPSLTSGIYSLTCDKDQSVASLNNGEIWQVEPTVSKLTSFPESYRVFLDSSGRLWAYGRKDVFWYDEQDGVWNEIPYLKALAQDFITCMEEDDRGALWFGYNSSGIKILSHNLKDKKALTVDNSHNCLSSNHISSLYHSKDGLLWVGTGKKGICFTSVNSLDVKVADTGLWECIHNIDEGSDGLLYLGFDGKGLISAKEDGKGGYAYHPIESPDNVICSTFIDSDGQYYFSTLKAGVFCIQNSHIRKIDNADGSFSKLTGASRDIIKDRYGNLWVGTYYSGLICLTEDGNVRQYTNDNTQPLTSPYIASLAYSEDGDMIYVCSTESVFGISLRTFRMEKLFDIHQIRTAYYDRHKILWVGTTDGLYYHDTKRPESGLLKLDVSNGLSNPCIAGMCSDANDNLWVTTNNGLTNIFIVEDPVSNSLLLKCYPYYAEDGIGDGQFVDNAICCTKSGQILLGCDDDIICISPSKLPLVFTPKKLSLTNVLVSGEPVILESGKPVKMKSHNSVTVSVSTMDYWSKNKLRYEYTVDDRQPWRPLPSNTLYLNSIKPGRHSIKVRVSDTDSNNPDHYTASLDVKVSPPIESSWGAVCIYLSLGILAIFALVQYQKRRLAEKEKQEKININEAKLQFFTNIGHDLRTPLTMIMTPLSKLIQDHKGEPVEETLILMNQSAHTLMDEVNQLLDFRKIEKDKAAFHPIYGDLCRFVSQTLESYTTIYSNNSIKLSVDLYPTPIMMYFDKDKVRRIIQNLLSNAYKYNKENGEIRVSVSREDTNSVIRVYDTGIGIRNEDKPHIFERFYQGSTESSVTGNGIGLHIVSEYAKMHGGTASVSDNQPCGSVFTITLPIQAEDVPEEIENSENSFTGKPKILIVEDNAMFRDFLAKSLKDSYDILEAPEGQTAFKLVETYPLDVIVTDVMMPVMDGRELNRKLKADIRYSGIPVIFLTAVQDKSVINECLKEGVDEYICKPFDIEYLKLKIQRILNTKDDTPEITVNRSDKEFLDRVTFEVTGKMSDPDYQIDSLAEAMGISRSSLYKKLFMITGMSPIEYIRSLRLKKGKKLMDEGESSISQIAYSVGFSPKQFTKHFKDEFGCLPSEYISHRKQNPSAAGGGTATDAQRRNQD